MENHGIPLIYEETINLRENINDLVNFVYKNTSKSKVSFNDNVLLKDKLTITINENN